MEDLQQKVTYVTRTRSPSAASCRHAYLRSTREASRPALTGTYAALPETQKEIHDSHGREKSSRRALSKNTAAIICVSITAVVGSATTITTTMISHPSSSNVTIVAQQPPPPYQIPYSACLHSTLSRPACAHPLPRHRHVFGRWLRRLYHWKRSRYERRPLSLRCQLPSRDFLQPGPAGPGYCISGA